MRPRNLELPRRLSGNSAPAGAIPAARVMVSSAKDLRRSALGMAISRGLGGLSRSPGERQKERQVTLQLLGNEEILLCVLMPMLAEFCRDFRMRKQKTNLIRRAFHGMRKQPGVFMDDLNRDAADGGSHHGLFLPQRFGDREPEAFAQTFLYDHRRSALQRVDF